MGLLALLSLGTSVWAQQSDGGSGDLHLQLHPVALDLRSGGHSLLTLGLVNQPTQLRGVSVAGLMSRLTGNSRGVQISGLISNQRSGSFTGFSMSPLMNQHRGRFHGMQISLINRAFDGRGLWQLGFINGAVGMSGVQLGAMSTSTRFSGVQLSGFANLSSVSAQGLQLSAVNIAGRTYGLVQLGFINAAAGPLRGLQLGAYNHTGRVSSPQIGLVNTANEAGPGVQLGLINISQQEETHQVGLMNYTPRTRIQYLIGGGSLTKINFGVRFTNGNSYSSLGVGLGYRSFSGNFSGSIRYRRGLIFPLSSRLSVRTDLGLAHIEDTPLPETGAANRRYALEVRGNIEYQITRFLAAYATGGYSFSSRYNRPYDISHRPIFGAGLAFF